jgi:hypothetical protein
VSKTIAQGDLELSVETPHLELSVETPHQQNAGRLLERLRDIALAGAGFQIFYALIEILDHDEVPLAFFLLHWAGVLGLAVLQIQLAIGLRRALEELALPFTVRAQVFAAKQGTS